jgi:hypothetical protein
MRDTKSPSNAHESPHSGGHIPPLQTLKTAAAQPAKADPVHAAVPLVPAWKAAAQSRIANRVKAVVKGPIRCHKCQLSCVDAEHYLNHGCEMRCQINKLRVG